MTDDLANCPHPDFAAFVRVDRIVSYEDEGKADAPAKAFSADIRIHCSVCEEPFRFIGVGTVGLVWDGPATNVTGTELRAPIEPQGERQLMPGRLAFEVPDVSNG